MSRFVVSYRNSTSNHNGQPRRCPLRPLYLIEILHQTTTVFIDTERKRLLYLIEILHQTTTIDFINARDRVLYLIEILHQTTTPPRTGTRLLRCILSKFYIKPQRDYQDEAIESRCILSKFYIKPQLSRQWLMVPCVVSYRNSTSNHNMNARRQWRFQVVSYRNSTSNHN